MTATRPGRGGGLLASPWTIYMVLAVLWLAGILTVPAFRSADNLSNVLERAAPLMIVAVGQSIVLVSGNYDLSVGGIMGLATAVASSTMEGGVLLGALATLTAGTAAGALNGWGVSKLKVNSVVMTLGTLSIAQGVGLYLRPYPGGVIPTSYLDVFELRVLGLPAAGTAVAGLTALVAVIVLEWRSFGRHVYIVGASEERAARAGIVVDRIKLAVFIVSGMLAAIAGLLLAAMIGSGDSLAGEPYMFESFTAALLGGIAVTGGEGKVVGTIGAVLLIASLASLLNLVGANTWYQNILLGTLMMGVVMIRIRGVGK